MRERCNQPSCAAFPRYGGRGITICDDWLGFVAFQRWALANGYADSLTIDRIDNDGIYEPDNCRWADAKTQARNTSRNPLFSYHGKTASLAEHAEDAGMPLSAVWQRVARLGWSIDKAMETPVRQMNRSMA